MIVTTTLYPIGYTGTSVTANKGSVSNLGNAYDGNSTSYASFNIAAGQGNTGEALTYYVFNFSVIPQNANIQSISIHSKAKKSSNPKYSTFRLSLFNGTTSIADKRTVTETTETTKDTLLTESEMLSFVFSSSPRIRVCANTSRSAITFTGYLYDLYLTVTYEVQSVTNKVKVNGSWVEAEPYVKVNGTWERATNAFVKVNGNWEEVI